MQRHVLRSWRRGDARRCAAAPPAAPCGERRAASSSPAVAASTTSTPRPLAAPDTEVAIGVPKSRSKRSGGSARACGRKEKMPPPPLSTTITVHGARGRRPPSSAGVTNALRSCKKARSPMTATTGSDPAAAHPRAVEVTPSMPLAPRLAHTLGGSASFGPYHSRSRIGMEEAAMTVVPGSTDPGRRRANDGSSSEGGSPSASSKTACAASSASCHRRVHSIGGRGPSSAPRAEAVARTNAPGSVPSTLPTIRWGSRHCQ